MIDVQPIETITYFKNTVPETPMPAIAPLFQWLGIPITTATLILFMFAAWGVWHWIIMFNDARLGLPNFIRVIKQYLDKDPRNGGR